MTEKNSKSEDLKCLNCQGEMVVVKLLSDTGVSHRHLHCKEVPDHHATWCKNEKRWIDF